MNNNVLYFEVVSSKTGIVDLEHKTSVFPNLIKDLDRKNEYSLKKMFFLLIKQTIV